MGRLHASVLFWQLFSNGSIHVSCLYIPLQWVILSSLDTRQHSYTILLLRATLSFIFHTFVHSIIQEARLRTWVERSLCASILGDRFLLKWRPLLVTLGDWQHLGDLGDWSVSSGACQVDCGSPKKFVRGLSSTTPGWWTETLSERPRLGDLGGDKTLSECHNVD